MDDNQREASEPTQEQQAEKPAVKVVEANDDYIEQHRKEFHARLDVLAKEIVALVATRGDEDGKIRIVAEKLKQFGG